MKYSSIAVPIPRHDSRRNYSFGTNIVSCSKIYVLYDKYYIIVLYYRIACSRSIFIIFVCVDKAAQHTRVFDPGDFFFFFLSSSFFFPSIIQYKCTVSYRVKGGGVRFKTPSSSFMFGKTLFSGTFNFTRPFSLIIIALPLSVYPPGPVSAVETTSDFRFSNAPAPPPPDIYSGNSVNLV